MVETLMWSYIPINWITIDGGTTTFLSKGTMISHEIKTMYLLG